jgi:hypothetical protein
MDFLKVFDAYSLRARLFPAIIAAAPALAAAALLISWKSFELSNVIATVALVVILYAISDVARARGKAIEETLYAEQGGKPSIVLFRRADPTIDDALKERYRIFVAGKLDVVAPTVVEEQANPAAADSFYDRCGVWLRANTRDTKTFFLLFNETVTYGFRRNLLGVKWPALGLNLLVVVICIILLWHDNWVWNAAFERRVLVVLIIAAIHAVYILSAVSRKAVNDASRTYGRELILSCEGLIRNSVASKPKPSRRKRT